MKRVFTSLFLSIFLFMPFATHAQILSVELVSVDSDETIGDDLSVSLDMTSDGRYVVFSSDATNLVSGDTNASTDVFLRDRTLGTTERISVSSADAEGDASSVGGSISSDGRYVVFASDATNLVSGDTNAVSDIFLRDRTLGTTTRISKDSGGGEPNGNSSLPVITPDGAYVLYYSAATDIVAGDTNSSNDLFLYDVDGDTTEIVSVSSSEVIGDGDSGTYGLYKISSDARYVIFDSDATNLVSGDTNASTDVFLRDRTLGTTERISVSSADAEGDDNSGSGAISSDGRYAVFYSDATNLVSGDTNSATDIFIRDRTAGTTERLSLSSSGTQGNGDSTLPFISSNGRFVTFGSSATNLVSDDTNSDPDIFMRDTLTDITERISLTEEGEEADGSLFNAALGVLTPNAQYVLLSSGHTDIVSGDTNNAFDVFLYELDDSDGISAAVEKAAPNSGDVNENGFIDSVEDNISSFVNSVSGNYATVETSGDCVRNDSPAAVAESTLGSQDSDYDYPLGIINFNINCKDSGETATISVYCFCENTPLAGLVARKYNANTGTYTTIDDATISEVTIDGSRALKMVYDVTDGDTLDEDGAEDGTIVDPVGFAQPVSSSAESSGLTHLSSGYSARGRALLAQNTTPIVSTKTNQTTNTCLALTTLMKLGSKYGEVSNLQQMLSDSGHNPGLIDGLFGPLTNGAVKEYQTANGLIIDGIVGPQTRDSLLQNCH